MARLIGQQHRRYHHHRTGVPLANRRAKPGIQCRVGSGEPQSRIACSAEKAGASAVNLGSGMVLLVTGKPRWPNLVSSQYASMATPAGWLQSSSVEKAGASAVSLGSGEHKYGPLGHGEALAAKFGLQYAPAGSS